ncbi:lipoate--protein ligase [Cysteiniphilum halobium]|uniref:lipoate--protein ligase n=1 Tax=Cysteiniphilum halobium TaxID=2219059 RepID=UPI000E652717|nr:lipoate--protein ligase [Cysteiniphilum halobium]
MNVYIATSHNPFYNLAVENWLFREMLTDTPILYLWQNAPCVIMGRAQNPWRECNIDALNNSNIPIVRRQSGGGTVYHDLGNLNYTIMAKSKDYDKKANLALIVNVLKNCGINAYASERNDILVTHENTDYKISGSAFRETKDKSFHHGTLLINADTSKLYHYLHHNIDKSLTAKGVHSKRSSVINLATVNPNINVEKIRNCFLNQFNQHITYIPEYMENKQVINEKNTLHTWQWRFGKTLPFSRNFVFEGDDITLEIKHGQIVAFKSNANKYFNLKTYFESRNPIYTQQNFSLSGQEALDFTAQEQALLTHLYQNTANVTGE